MKSVKSEFAWKNFRLSHPDKSVFCTSQWDRHPCLYLTCRLLLAVYSLAALLGVLIPAFLNSNAVNNVMTYLTIWTYTLLTFHLSLAALVSLRHYVSSKRTSTDWIQGNTYSNGSFVRSEGAQVEQGAEHGLPDPGQRPIKCGAKEEAGASEDRDDLPWVIKVSWVLANITQHFSLIVTVIYFSVIYPSLPVPTGGDLVNDLNVHAVNSVFVFIDMAFSARPIRLLHAIHPMSYGLAYVIFSAIYWSTDKQNHVLYSILDWNHPAFSVAMVALLAFVGVPLLQTILYALYRLRVAIYLKYYHPRDSS